jgi:hypothetical protein
MTTDSQKKLEDLIAVMTDPADLSESEVRGELATYGINLAAAQTRLGSKLDELMADRALRRRFAGNRAPTPALLERVLNEVRAMRLEFAELAARIAQLQPQRGFRELTSSEREDLETQYAELLAIQATQNGEVK